MIRFTGGDEIKNTEESGDDFVCSWTGSPTTTPWAFGRPLSVGLYSLYSQGAGPEYNSAKEVIPSSNSEQISHGIFYTAITRAKEKLKIF
ncbi:MAG: hypothetical protein ACLRIS_15795 [Flavonifractor plautii]